ncbi:acyl-CoA synthetase short-chain family member 3, mitochondrial [Willisornis vidua]|uniref:Acyl-CoA synthetase short-chain family member 3, mitochondrial n=1 Tax=Willisornis vidua TaxID=1566151 RepID=A0ABQ9CTW8_9PASS|nr:acyl-CoA synthetase short-chain family member 3, mitochondrial [Willisornis vidua]
MLKPADRQHIDHRAAAQKPLLMAQILPIDLKTLLRFVGGELNICYNAVDRHVENGRGDQVAIIYDSPVTNTKEKITYKELLEQVSKLADVMVRHGVKKGDRVVIYMPMIPQTVYCMLACARIGAIHSLIFGGFASKELSIRIDHAKPKLIVTASFGVEPKRKVEYISLLEGALARVQSKPDKVLIYKRPNLGDVPFTRGRDLDWEEELAKAQYSKCVSVPSEHPLYILYTSGTTGLPKGVVRPTGGCAVMLNWTMSAVYGLTPGEGKPVGTPDAGAYFRVLAEHEVTAAFTSPTAIRAIRQQDPEAALGKQYSLKRFRTLFVAGEHCDVDTLEWSKKVFKVPVLDHWWQTESGSAITASCIGLGNSTSPPPGQAGKPVPGYNVMILDENKEPVKANTLGTIVVNSREGQLIAAFGDMLSPGHCLLATASYGTASSGGKETVTDIAAPQASVKPERQPKPEVTPVQKGKYKTKSVCQVDDDGEVGPSPSVDSIIYAICGRTSPDEQESPY